MPQVDETTPPRVLLNMLNATQSGLAEQANRADRAERELRKLRGEPEPEPVDVETLLAAHGL